MASPFPLSTVKAGITRLRDKGGASPDSLYDLVNGIVDASRAPVSRPPARAVSLLPPGTKGLMYYKGKRLVFSAEPVEMTDPKYINETLRHPTEEDATLVKIHFAQPFLGVPFVVAEFDNDGAQEFFSYWLQRTLTWEADHIYTIGQVVQPTVPNGYAYRAGRIGDPGLRWAKDILRAIGDRVEPTVYNGYVYVVVDVQGANPRSGSAEPTWPTSPGAQVIEDTDGAEPTPDGSATDPTGSSTVPEDIRDRYGVGVGSNQNRQSIQ